MKPRLTFFYIGKTKKKKELLCFYTYQRLRIGAGPVVDQLVLEGRDPPADVSLRHGLDEQRPLVDAETVHFAFGLLGLAEQQAQFTHPLQVDVRAARFPGRFDAHGEVGGGRRRHIGPQVDDDGARRVQPLERALRAAEVHLLHIACVSFMCQTTARDRKGVSG